MELTSIKAIEILRHPVNKLNIDDSRDEESQLRVFTEKLSKRQLQCEGYWQNLTAIASARSHKKFERVMQFARYPLPIVSISNSVLSDFYKVFEGKNRHFNVNGDRDLSRLTAWIDETNLEHWIEDKAREVFKNKPCSFVVVDKDDKGSPYLVYVDADRLVDAVFKNKRGSLEYIAFIHSTYLTEDGHDVIRYSVYDDTKYYVFDKRRDQDDYILISEHPHNIGYCPAVAFLSQTANSDNYFDRKAAFSYVLPDMEDWTLFDVFRNYVDHYAPFPVTESPSKKCVNPDCINGKIRSETLDPRDETKTKVIYLDCDACKDRESDFIYPGAHIGINVAREKSQNDGSGVFKMIFPDTEALKYTPEKLDNLELDIRYKTVGVNSMDSQNEAMNELQVKGSYTSMETVLTETKKELDKLYKWIVSTVAKSFYKNIDVKVDANFGTEFYLMSEEDLQDRFDTAKKIGLPQEEQMTIYEQIIDTKYKGNPNKILRQKMLLQLDPMPLYTVQEVIDLAGKQLVDQEALFMKINFLNFVSRFETENAPITQFGTNLEIEERINIIREELKKYNAAKMASMPKPQLEPPINNN